MLNHEKYYSKIEITSIKNKVYRGEIANRKIYFLNQYVCNNLFLKK